MKNIYDILEFNKVLLKLSDFATLDDNKLNCQNLKILNTYDNIKNELDETDSAVSYIRLFNEPHFDNIKNIDDVLIRLSKDATLSQSELINISKLLDTAENLISYQKSKDFESKLDIYFNKLYPLTYENNNIKRIILSETEIADNASSTLLTLRRKKKMLNEKMKTIGARLLNTYSEYLQEPVLSYKDNTICLVVKSEYKNKIDGIVHSISGSQFSMFIEPKEISSIKNEITENIALEEIEIAKILSELSRTFSPHIDILKSNYENILKLDFIFAKAKYARDLNATLPLINNDGQIMLFSARHPLISKDKIVPLDINIGISFNSLIITGPNTGGKTVSLKTVGLIVLMTMSGLFIPANENSKVGIFDNIFADIGDEQSIEQNLSTFSSHMTNIVTILKNTTNKSLVLLDEICTGTDPIEGANLAIAILDELKNIGAKVIATTHYPELKRYALTKDNVKNGSFEFDVETLKPTYKLLIGLPGKSNAFAISEKLGLDKKIIENAKSHLDSKDIKFEDVMANLEESRRTIEKEKETIAKYKIEIEELKNKVKRQEKGLNDRADSIIRQAKEKAYDILYDAKKSADDTIRSIKAEGVDLSGAINVRSKLNKKINESIDSLSTKTKGPSKPISPKKIKLGSTVKVLSLNAEGVVESLPDKDYNLFVRIGIMKTHVNLRDLEFVDTNNIKIDGMNIKRTTSKTGSSKIKYEKSHSVSPEINLIGLTADDAIYKLDKYIDDAYIAHLSKVRIIHGRGKGILKDAINEYCRKSTLITEHNSGNFDEGGDGVTIAILKE